jgi:hypothetical protein
MSKSIAIPLVAVLGIAACGGAAPPANEDEPAEGRDVEMDDPKDAARSLGLRSLAAEG